MPPKGGKGGGKKAAAIIIDGVDTSEMNREKLEQFTLKVKEELDKEREERNYFQLERDKIRTFWEITRQQLEEAKAELRNRERATEEAQEENEALLETEKQKIKHLKYEQQAACAALRAENLVALKAAKEEHTEQELELLNDKRALRQEMREKTLAAQDELRRAKLIHAEELSKTRSVFEEKARQIEDKAEKKLQETKIELTVKHRTEISEVEERKNKQLSELIAHHERAFSDLKNYYNDITLNNLGLISSLKQQMEDMQKVKERAEKVAKDAVAESKSLREPLEAAIVDNKELKRQMSNYDRNKAALAAKTKQLASLEQQFEVLKWEYEVLQVRFDRILKERDELKLRFSRAVLEVQQRASLKTALLEAKLKSFQGRDLNPREIHELLKMKDNQVEDLRYEAARLRKAHDDLLATYEAKLTKLGVPLEELGFKPLKAVAVAGLSPVVGQGPAGLVAKDQI
ncbi:dynein regulatory complex subunit 4 isoform X2 [Maniola hyperantus]|uniref:dynein regulatory complex subunit 4 isoform X2 n=2 Tax=Aphantopus hyperantus TaxID=2795564 RepID=UPI00156A0C1B|nr:dynein regulatory complex subunit 4 [Maniola hyperantus]